MLSQLLAVGLMPAKISSFFVLRAIVIRQQKTRLRLCNRKEGYCNRALVDFSDLNKMPDAFEFNRCLYVAVTRSREFLALVVT